MIYLAAASSALRPVLTGPASPAERLGVARGTLYLRTFGPPGALAVLAHDAVRLPCGMLLATTSEELPLAPLAPPESTGFVVGGGAVSWTGPAGPVEVQAVSEWAPARPARGKVAPSALAAVRLALVGTDPAIDGRLVQQLSATADDQDAAVAIAARLLGRGPGLTPSGDDVLAGFLIGAAAFGLNAAPLREAVAAQAPRRTSALSAALLWHAARGECIDEVADVAAVLTGREQIIHGLSRLLSVGHSSGAALAYGLLAAAESALSRQEGRAA